MAGLLDTRLEREESSIFDELYAAARQQEAALEQQGRRSVLGGLFSKEPVQGIDTVRFEGMPGLLSMLTPAAKAVDAPISAYRGLIPDDDMLGEALGTAGLAMGGGGVVAGRNAMAYDPNTTNIFAGRRADFTAQPPDKNPGMTSLDDANKMLADGKSNREIYNETGWFQGADGKFRFEIDDKDAKLTLPRWLRNHMLDGETMPFRLDQILDHPEFYKAYPDAARKQVNLSRPDGYSSTMGSYNPYTDQISARIDRPDDDVLGTILHEVQHSTQRREGFSGGSNSETSKEQAREFSNVIMSDPKVGSLYDSSDKFSQLSMQLQPLYRADYIDSLDNLVEKARNGSAKPRDITGIQDWYIHGSDIVSKQGAMPRRNGPERDQWIAQAAHYIRREALARDADSVRSVYDKYPSVKDRKNAIRRFERQRDKHRAAHFEYAKVGKSVEDLRGLSSWDAYQREAGETEARNVQTRLELGREGDKRSPAQDGVFPGDTQDFAFTDQVVSNLRRGQPVPSVRSNKLNANASKSAGLLAASLPEPRNAGEAMAQRILEMRSAGKAGDVTDEMMAQADPQYMFNNTPLDMSEAARMARAEGAGFDVDLPLYHGTDKDFYGFIPSDKGLIGPGVYATPETELANTFAGGTRSPNATVFERMGLSYPDNSNVLSLIGTNNPAPPDVRSNASAARRKVGVGPEGTKAFNRELGEFDGVSVDRQRTYANPANIRSRFARFDPEFSQLSNLSAANASPLTGLMAMQAQSQPDLAAEIRAYLESIQ